MKEHLLNSGEVLTPRTKCVVLHGSFGKHLSIIHDAARVFRTAGLMVLAPSIDEVADDNDDFIRFAGETDLSPLEIETNFIAQMLRLLESGSSGFSYFVCPEGYMGNSARIEYGLSLGAGIKTFFSERPNDTKAFPIDDRQIMTPTELVRHLQAGDLTHESSFPSLTLTTHHLAIGGVMVDKVDRVLLVDDGRHDQVTVPGTRLRPDEDMVGGLARLEEKFGLVVGNFTPLQIAELLPDSSYRGPKSIIFKDGIMPVATKRIPNKPHINHYWTKSPDLLEMIESGQIEPNASHALLTYLLQR